MKFAVWDSLPLFSVEVSRMCVAQTSGPPTSCVMPAWLFVEGRVSGVCKQVSQITTHSTTNVTSSRHRLINIAIKIRCQDSLSHWHLSQEQTPNVWIPPFLLSSPWHSFVDTACPSPGHISLFLRSPWICCQISLLWSSFLLSPFPFLLAWSKSNVLC